MSMGRFHPKHLIRSFRWWKNRMSDNPLQIQRGHGPDYELIELELRSQARSTIRDAQLHTPTLSPEALREIHVNVLANQFTADINPIKTRVMVTRHVREIVTAAITGKENRIETLLYEAGKETGIDSKRIRDFATNAYLGYVYFFQPRWHHKPIELLQRVLHGFSHTKGVWKQ
jgi:hypothetical protein